LTSFARLLACCPRGTAVVETALVAPVLAMMAVGIFEAGTIVQKQQELQSAANESEAIILAAAAGSGVTSTKLKELLVASTGLSASKISLAAKWRCNNSPTLVDSAASCSSGQRAYEFVQATFTSSYTPTWASFGLGGAFNYSVVRTIQVG
jgi:Flp pilus assembly protein TadG